MALQEGQWQIEDIVFGKNTIYPIAVAPEISTGDIDNQDHRIPRADGIYFGEDSRGANKITFEMAVWSNNLDFDHQKFVKWWKNHPVRKKPGAAIPLKYCFEGQQRQVWGRPRNYAPLPSPTRRKWVKFICDFQCIDDKFYSQELFTHRIPISPPSLGGFITPLISPLVMQGSELTTKTQFSVGGMSEAWCGIKVAGPISAPQVELYDEWTQTMRTIELNYDQYLQINSFPWDRKIIKDGYVPQGGVFDQASRKLSELWIPPGDHEMVLRGNDPTGSSFVDLSWYETYLTM